MPISKRLLYTATAHAPPSLLTNSTDDSALGDVGIARAIGAIQQLNNLAMYAAEIFDNISLLSEDTCGRLKELTARTSNVMKALPVVEARVFGSTIAVSESDLIKASHSARKATSIPTVLTKRTNCLQINSQYDKCSLPPQLWKLESVIPEDCMMNYSDPGFFFKEWLKQEQQRQEEDRKERKKTKELKRTAKLERRKQRQAAQKETSTDKSDSRKSLRRTVSLPTKPTPRASVAGPTGSIVTNMNSGNVSTHKSAARTLFNTPMGTNSPPRAIKRQSTIGTLQPSSALRKGMPPLLSSQTPNSAASIAYRTPTMRLFSMEEEMRQDGVDPHAKLVPTEALPQDPPPNLRDDATPTPPPVEELYGPTSRQPFSSLPQSYSSLDGVAPPSRRKSILTRSATTVETGSSRSPNRGSMVGGAPMSPPDDPIVTPENRKRRSIIQAASFSKASSGPTSTKAPAQVMMRSSISFRKTTGEDVAYLGVGVPGTRPPIHPRGSVSGPLGTTTTASSAMRSRHYEAGNGIKDNNVDDELQSFDSRQGIKSHSGGNANNKLQAGVPSFMTHYSTFDMSPPALDPAASNIIFGGDKFKLDLDDAWYRSGADHDAEQPQASGVSQNAGHEGSDRGESTNRSVSSSTSQRKPSIGMSSVSNATASANKSKPSTEKKPSKPAAPPTLGFGSVLDFLPPDMAYLKDFKDENEFYKSNLGFSTNVAGESSAEGEDLPPPPGDEEPPEAPGYDEHSEYEQQGEMPAIEAERFVDENGNEGYYDPEGRPYYLASDGNYYYYEEEPGGGAGSMQDDASYENQVPYYEQDEDVQRQRMGMLDAIRNAGKAQLRQVVPIERRVDVRQQLMENIREGAVALRPTTVNVKTNIEQKHEAIAAILSNRSKIAGSDSDSDTSDSDFSDDDYF